MSSIKKFLFITLLQFYNLRLFELPLDNQTRIIVVYKKHSPMEVGEVGGGGYLEAELLRKLFQRANAYAPLYCSSRVRTTDTKEGRETT